MSPETAGSPHRCSAPLNEHGREPRAYQGVSLRAARPRASFPGPAPAPRRVGGSGEGPVPTRPSPEVPIVLAAPPLPRCFGTRVSPLPATTGPPLPPPQSKAEGSHISV